MLHPNTLILALWVSLPQAAGAHNPAASAVLPRPAALLPLVLVQDEGSDDSDDEADQVTAQDMPEDAPPEDAIGITEAETEAVAEALSDGTRFCGSGVDASFKADCLADQYKAAAQTLPRKGGYSAARKALLTAADQLHALATQNADASQSAVKVSAGTGRSHRPLTPVANPAAVNAKAAAIVDATKVVLLRSSAGSEQRRAAYTAIAGGV